MAAAAVAAVAVAVACHVRLASTRSRTCFPKTATFHLAARPPILAVKPSIVVVLTINRLDWFGQGVLVYVIVTVTTACCPRPSQQATLPHARACSAAIFVTEFVQDVLGTHVTAHLRYAVRQTRQRATTLALLFDALTNEVEPEILAMVRRHTVGPTDAQANTAERLAVGARPDEPGDAMGGAGKGGDGGGRRGAGLGLWDDVSSGPVYYYQVGAAGA